MIALAAALYLFDCVVLLERGQAVLEARWSRVALGFGSRHYQIGGRAVALLNPFTPFIPVFRTLPLFSAPDASNPRVSKAVRAVTPASALSLLQFLLIFVALPYCLYRAPGWPFFISLLLAYLNAVAMLGFIWWRFGKAGIPTRPLAALGFAWLVCLPLSVNALRKAGLACNIALDARRAIRFLAESERQSARDELAAQIAEAMQELEESDERHHRLAELRRQLTPEAGDGRV
ncbi:MAG: hypothetical protein AABM33_10405 [Pseudomonadota bacterium]